MKSVRRNKVLGLAIGDRSIVAAEVRSSGGQPEVARVAEYTYPEGATLQQPDAIGKGLGEFLKEQGFTAKHTVIGLPAKWILSKTREVPGASPSVVNESLRLQAEGEFSQELKDLVFDYAGEPSDSEARPVLLMAVPRRYVEGARAMAEAARLDPLAVTASAVTLGAATAGGRKEAMVLSVGPGGAEFTVQQGAYPRVLRHVGSPASPAPLLVGELRRSTAMLGRPAPARVGAGGPPGANGVNGNGGHELTVWDEAALAPATLRSIGDALGVSLRTGRLESLGLTAPEAPQAPDAAPEAGVNRRGYAAAVSLALAGMSEEGLAVDFLHSRLAPPKKKGLLQQRTFLIAAAALVVIACACYAYVDRQGKEADLAAMQQRVKKGEPEAKVNQAYVDRISFAQRWHRDNPWFLACLADLTRRIPEDGQTVVTSFVLRGDNLVGTLSGKTGANVTALDLGDQLTASKRFTNVKVSFTNPQQARGRDTTRETQFQVQFTYVPEGTQPSPSSAPSTPMREARPGRRGR